MGIFMKGSFAMVCVMVRVFGRRYLQEVEKLVHRTKALILMIKSVDKVSTLGEVEIDFVELSLMTIVKDSEKCTGKMDHTIAGSGCRECKMEKAN